MRSKKWHMIDRALVNDKDWKHVKKCVVAPMLIDSDHHSIRLHLRFKQEPRRQKSKREEQQQHDIEGVFGAD